MKHVMFAMFGLFVVGLLAGCQADQQARTNQPVLAEGEEDGGNPLEALAFWTWFDDGEPEPITAADIRADMSPARTSLGETGGEMQNSVARTMDTNLSAIWGDLGRLLLIDRPSRSTLYPVP